MEEKENPADEEETRTVYCPGCDKHVPLHNANLFVEFYPQVATLSLSGDFDLGQFGDVFMDYSHLGCGTKVRIASNAGWSEELGEYVPHPNIMIEIDSQQDGGRVLYGDIMSEGGDPEGWRPTYATLLEAYQKACNLFMERLETES